MSQITQGATCEASFASCSNYAHAARCVALTAMTSKAYRSAQQQPQKHIVAHSIDLKSTLQHTAVTSKAFRSTQQ
eukprot:1142912-Pelagomonas_calceolata.AAC.5